MAITLGSGSTERSSRLLEELLKARRAELRASRTLWLLRPNEESRLEDSNVRVARDRVRAWARTLALGLSGRNGADKN
ncbi:MAG: hypothetical protein ACO20F_06720 [Robiginitalea sp.]